jgi:hypothetical protein
MYTSDLISKPLIGESVKVPTMTRIIDFHTKNRAKYTYDVDVVGHTIEIRDIGGGKTIASDAENVIKDLVERGYSVDRFVIRYQNSLGSWGQLLTTNSEFSGFVPA